MDAAHTHVALDIIASRLRNHRLAGQGFSKPQDVVRWMGAVQAQEYVGGKWAIGLRMRRGGDAAIESALASGTILRTHILRPTWHFVTPEDIRWMLALTGPRISASMASHNRKLELDAALFRRSHRAIARALRGGICLTRQEIKEVLRRAGIHTDGVQRLSHIVIQAEADAVVCSGPLRGKQLTYALLDERVPAIRARSRDEALSELARRYFTSHGPAQLHDFAWWSGLTVRDARAGVANVEHELARETIAGRTYWFSSSAPARPRSDAAQLLSLYDEYLIAYKDRTAALDPIHWGRITSRDPFSAPVIVDGRVVGGWKKTVTTRKVVVKVMPFARLRKKSSDAIADAVDRFGRFLGLEASLVLGR